MTALRLLMRTGRWLVLLASMFFAVSETVAQTPVRALHQLQPDLHPGAIAIVQKLVPSWRDLPIRLAEMGVVGRWPHLLHRRPVPEEIARFVREVPAFYRRFGFDDVSVALSLRPPNRIGDDARWDRAEHVLREIVASLGIPIDEQPGAGAIYGPKLEFVLRDRRGRPWQCGTMQLDFFMPQRFDVRYVDANGDKQLVVMLHRALLGSLERFIAILIDHHGGALPAWLAPEQVAFLPVGTAHVEYARVLAERTGLRARVDADGTLSKRILRAHHDGVPFAVVLGDRETIRAPAAMLVESSNAQPMIELLDTLTLRRASSSISSATADAPPYLTISPARPVHGTAAGRSATLREGRKEASSWQNAFYRPYGHVDPAFVERRANGLGRQIDVGDLVAHRLPHGAPEPEAQVRSTTRRPGRRS